MGPTPYLHILDGRLRVRIPAVKRSPQKAAELEHRLQAMDGVTSVEANPSTGGVLVYFDSAVVSAEQILKALDAVGLPAHGGNGRAGFPSHVAFVNGYGAADQSGRRLDLTQIVVEKVVEVAATRLIAAIL